MKKIIRIAILALVLVSGYSCSKSHSDDDNKYLISFTHLAEYDVDQIAKMVEQETGYDIIAEFRALIPDMTLCFDKILYKSIGRNCSALVVTPKDVAPKGMLLGMHYTIGRRDEAPTESLLSVEELSVFLGMYVVIPDYIGFGEASDEDHPYLHVESTAKDAICAVKAAREYFSSVKRLDMGKSLYVAGYSEGGGNALAVQKVAERDEKSEIHIEKVYCGGALTDMTETEDFFIGNDYAEYPYGVAMAFLGLNAGEGLNLDFDKIFTGELADKYEDWILSKEYYTYEVNEFIGSTKASDFLHPDFFTAKGNSEIARFRQVAEKNSLVDGWTPQAPILMVHGMADYTVPFLNAQCAYDAYKAKGCDVELVAVEDAGHEETMFTYILEFYTDLASILK